MAVGKITKRSVEALEVCPGKDQYLWDTELKGFGVKVTAKGRRVYLIQYKAGGARKRTRRLTLGVHGVLTADQARDRAKAALGDVAAGRDPAEHRDRARSAKTMAQLVERFIVEHVEQKLKSATAAEYKRSLQRHLPKTLRLRPISDITHRDISALHHQMRDTPYQANRMIAVLSKFFNWCEQNGYRREGSNPCRHIQKYKEHKRERFLSQQELARLSAALRQAEAEKTASPWVIAAIRLLVFTGARLNEILTLRWEYVDLERAQIRLPDSKTGAKTIYLNAPAIDVLTNIPRLHDNPHVICGDKKGAHLVNLQKPWRRLRASADLEDVRLHDLRHTFASIGAATGISLPIIGGLVGHTQPGTTARYAHLSNHPLMQAANSIGSEIARAMNGKEPGDKAGDRERP